MIGCEGAAVAVHDSAFSGNSAIFTGGALFVRDVGEMVLTNVRIESHQGGNRGGAEFVAADRESSALRLVGSTIVGNGSKGTGGIAATGRGLSVTLEGVTLENNRSESAPRHADCSSEHPGVFRSLAGNRIASSDGFPMDAAPSDRVGGDAACTRWGTSGG